MIRTVTLNTGFDEILTVTPPDSGGVGELLDRQIIPSGKGVNCARTVRALDCRVKAYGLIGADSRVKFLDALAVHDIDASFISLPGRTRVNATIQSPNRSGTTHYRAEGFTLQNEDPIDELIQVLSNEIDPGDVVSLHGSTPHGVSSDTWKRIGSVVRQRQGVLLVDVYGEPLVRILNGLPILVCKPNEVEIASLPGVDEVQSALRYMAEGGVELPIVSRGERGAMFATGGEIWTVRLNAQSVNMLVGAGDAWMAGLAVAISGGERRPQELVRAGIVVAVAHVEATPLAALAQRARELSGDVRFEQLAPF